MQAAIEQVSKSLPNKTQNYRPVADISEKSGLEITNVRSALAKMKREKLVKSNGKRGAAGGWRKAK